MRRAAGYVLLAGLLLRPAAALLAAEKPPEPQKALPRWEA